MAFGNHPRIYTLYSLHNIGYPLECCVLISVLISALCTIPIWMLSVSPAQLSWQCHAERFVYSATARGATVLGRPAWRSGAVCVECTQRLLGGNAAAAAAAAVADAATAAAAVVHGCASGSIHPPFPAQRGRDAVQRAGEIPGERKMHRNNLESVRPKLRSDLHLLLLHKHGGGADLQHIHR